MEPHEILGINLRRLLEGEKQIAVAAQAKGAGHKITQSYISGLAKGKFKNPTLKKLTAIAVGLEVDLAELFRPVHEKNAVVEEKRTPTKNEELHLKLARILEAGSDALNGIALNIDAVYEYVNRRVGGKPRQRSAVVRKMPIKSSGPPGSATKAS